VFAVAVLVDAMHNTAMRHKASAQGGHLVAMGNNLLRNSLPKLPHHSWK
jgi:hypothetical protein